MKFSRTFKVVLLFLVCSILFSCAGMNRVPVQLMKDRLQYRGFSVARPNYSQWYLNNNEQDNTKALFRRDLKTPTHTYLASVMLQSIPRDPSSPEDLAEIEKEFHKIQDTQRFELLKYTQRIETRQNQWCIYYEETIIDRKAPNAGGKPLIGRSWGFVTLHPSFNKTVVHAYYSERGLEDELDPKLIDEGEEFLKGIQIESAPGKPVG